jgi:D-alanyl-D-alanine carboxypeptidase/D-alanyl-D-alanine-endopeptidase (penicillin-binding protein 4)
MREIVARMLAPSQNWIAEQLLKTLGAEFGAEGSWRGGLAVERSYLIDVVRIDSGAVNLRDASGLSAQNLLTPAATVALLAHARSQPWGAAYRAGLPTPGTPGTLSGRLRSLEGRVAAKTGTISNVNSLSGYLTADGGRELIFGVFTNGSGLPSALVRSAIDSVVVAVARHAGR